MSNNTTTTGALRVRYAGQPSATTAQGLPSADTDLSGYDVNSLKGLRGKIDDALQADTIGDDHVVNYLDLQKRCASKIQAIEARNSRLAELAVSAPAVHTNGFGDTSGSLKKRFSISKAISSASLGHQQDGAEAEVIQEGQKSNPMARGISLPSFMFERRNIYGVDAASADITAAVSGQRTVSAQLLAALHDEPVAAQLGATMVQASGAHFLVPFLGSMIPSSTDEGGALTSNASFNQLDLTPTRYGRRADITTLSLRAASPEMDEIIMRSMAEGHATAKDRAAFAAVVANATYQLATAHSTNGLAATDLEDIFNLAKSASVASGNSAAPNMVCSPIGFQALNTATDANINQTMSGAYRNGTGAQVLQSNTLLDGDLTSANVVGGTGTIAGAGVAIAGNFSDLIVAEWGVDLVLDNVTDADRGVIRCISNSYIAAGVVRDSLRVMGVSSSNIAAT